MRPLFPVLFLLASVATSPAQSATTALSALRLVPKADIARLARIEAREGKPTPERWHILVYDSKEATGLREYVVAGGEVTASRALSQFAEVLKPEDVIEEPVGVDSDRAVRTAQDFARANRVVALSFSYQLRQAGSAPQWTVGCVGEGGKRIGEVVVHAGNGSVLSRSGFAMEPLAARPDPIASSEGLESERERVRRTSQKRTVARSRPVQPPPTPAPKPNPLRKLGDSFGRIFGR